MKKSRVMIAEDHVILREGLKSLLASHPRLEIVSEAGTGLEAIRLMHTLKPDLLLLDLAMPEMSGMTALPTLRKISPVTRIIVLTIHQTDEYSQKPAGKPGLAGYPKCVVRAFP